MNRKLRMRKNNCLCGMLVLVTMLAAAGVAADTTQPERPRIGLALAGGGARGFAHIGVLRWFEEHRIPVDMVAGTSMGGLVGAMYSMGMTAREMEELTEQLDWEQMLGPGASYQELKFRRKEDRRDFQTSLDLGLRDGLASPAGLRDAHQVRLLLDRLTLPYHGIESFDELPIPFRAVATDMEAAEPVVMGDGPLALALRATMSIPGVFPPVEREERILADGSLLNNVPTDVLQDMGADIIIAVDIGTPLGDRESFSSLTGMLVQSWAVMSIQNVRENLRLATIILSPDLEDFTFTDYRSAEQIADLGYSGTEAKEQILLPLAVSEEEWEAILQDRRSRMRTVESVPQFVRVEGAGPAGNDAIARRVEPFIGFPLEPAALESELTAITGWGQYASLNYSLIEQDGQTGLLIGVQRHRHGPPFLRFGLEANGAETDNVILKLGSRLTMFDVGGRGSELRTDIVAGSEYSLSTEYWRPVGGRWFVAPRLLHEQDSRSLFEGGARIAEYRIAHTGLALDLGFHSGRNAEFRLGYRWMNIDSDLRIGDPGLPLGEGPERAAILRWQYDGRDNPVVPTRGMRTSLGVTWYQSAPQMERSFLQAEGLLSAFRPLTPTSSAFLMLAGGTTFDRNAPAAQQFVLGGPLRLSAYSPDEFRGNAYVAANIGYLRRTAQFSPLTGAKIYTALWLEGGRVFDGPEEMDLLFNVSAGLIAETPLGPVLLSGSLGESGNRKVSFLLGRVF